MADSIHLTRQELYDRVWSTPAWKLGPELGMSGRGLAKLCAREGIPVPNRGWWAKKEFGWNPTQKQLPPRKGDQGETIEFDLHRTDASLEVENGKPLPDPAPIPASLENPHALVAATLKSSRMAKSQVDDTLMLHGPGGLTVDVSRESLDRALRILDAVIRVLESKGCTARAAKGGKETSGVALNEDVVELSIEEVVTRTEKQLTPWQLKDKQRNPWRYSFPKYDYSPTGRLKNHLEQVYGSGVRRTWGDGKKTRLESLLPRAVASVLDLLAAKAAARKEREEYSRVQRERERERLARAREQFLADRRAAIVEQRLNWARLAKEISEWLPAVESARSLNEGTARWVEWIAGYVGRLETASKKLPEFEVEPTYEDKSKYILYSQY